ncbi:MAG: serine/threonine protein kinase [Candidatus Hydrogenedentes bacterium]|nr:serine/threonine protein kinase [Candidatus Hydrogenedentota bacterium]
MAEPGVQSVTSNQADAPTTPYTPNDISDKATFVDSFGDAADSFRLAAIGSMLDGRYRVRDVKGGPGRSGMGIVYIVDGDDGPYAAKTFQHHFARNLPLVQRFLREARTWMLTGFHPNIVHAYFIEIINAVPYLFMQYVEPDADGRLSLADYLRNGPVPLEQALDWAIQCCDGMAHATLSVPGLVHRDLKPENLLIAPDGTLKITDFGLVRCRSIEGLESLVDVSAINRPNITHVGSAFGTPAYMAPEQFAAADDVNETADIYAFGCCMYEAISGARVFTVEQSDNAIHHMMQLRRMHESQEPAPLRELVRNCPQDVDRIIMRCLEKSPHDRWQSFEELRIQFAFVQDNVLQLPIPARAYSEPTPDSVGRQLRSLTLLDGYHRAVRLQDLRDSQDTSPYAFHLALASYFRSAGEFDEERRQLEKAVNARTVNEGYEAARRLAELWLQEGEFSRADAVLDSFLSEDPRAIERLLEPAIGVRIVRQEFREAEELLDSQPPSLRTGLLRAALLRAQCRCVDAAQVWRGQVSAILASIAQKLGEVSKGDRVGWEVDGDADVLSRVLAIIAPECDTAPLRLAEHAVWPELDVYPDFSADMAWLSNALGELADNECVADSDEAERIAECAKLLGYPDRLPRHLTRDEQWFWDAADQI